MINLNNINIIIFGPSGVGKSHLAAAIGLNLIMQNMRVLFTQTTTIVQELQQARSSYKLPEALAKLAKQVILLKIITLKNRQS